MKYRVVGETHEAAVLMRKVRDKHHAELMSAKIAVAFFAGKRPDMDGHLKLGQLKLVDQLDKEFHGNDFVVLLNDEAWQAFDVKKRMALIDHELSHAAPVIEKDDETQATDTDGKLRWRTRRHDVEEFEAVVARNGVWNKDLAAFAKECVRKADAPLFRDLRDAATEESQGMSETNETG